MNSGFYVIRENPSGRVVDESDTIDYARKAVADFERLDKEEGIYSPNRYYITKSWEED